MVLYSGICVINGIIELITVGVFGHSIIKKEILFQIILMVTGYTDTWKKFVGVFDSMVGKVDTIY